MCVGAKAGKLRGDRGRDQTEMPETGDRGTVAAEDQASLVVHLDSCGIKSDLATGVTELPHGEQGSSGEGRNDVDTARRQGETRQVKFSLVG